MSKQEATRLLKGAKWLRWLRVYELHLWTYDFGFQHTKYVFSLTSAASRPCEDSVSKDVERVKYSTQTSWRLAAGENKWYRCVEFYACHGVFDAPPSPKSFFLQPFLWLFVSVTFLSKCQDFSVARKFLNQTSFASEVSGKKVRVRPAKQVGSQSLYVVGWCRMVLANQKP